MNQENTIQKLEKEIIDAMLNADIQTLDKLIHEDLCFNIPTGQTVSKAMDLEGYKSGNMSVHSISVTDQQIQLFNDTATVCSTLHMVGAFMKHPINGVFRFMRIWKKFEDQWQIIAGSSIEVQNQ